MKKEPKVEFRQFDWEVILKAVKKMAEDMGYRNFHMAGGNNRDRTIQETEYIERFLIPNIYDKLNSFSPKVRPPKFDTLRSPSKKVTKRKRRTR